MLGCYDSPADLGILRWAYKWTREFARRMDSYRGELAAGHPEFPAGSQAALKITASGPDPIDSPKIVYTAEDDAAIDEFHRNTGSPLYLAIRYSSLKCFILNSCNHLALGEWVARDPS